MLFGQFDLAGIFNIDYNTAFTWYWCAMIILYLLLFNMLLAIVLAAFDHVRKASHERSVPYVAALNELWQLEGFWLWPWYRLTMVKFGQCVDAGTFTTIDTASVAKQLDISPSKAARVLRKTRAFLTVMNVLRDVKKQNEEDDGFDDPDDGFDIEPRLDLLQQKLDKLEALVEGKLASVSVNLADLAARIDAKL
ncbi:Aste57867_4731 [Aphanomyces stellatus]|uniref:Aste57867_4731 protein n=1 Tax=Aphanomyces stellatus TaxID=120398 RepID=A0A485KBT8_9STRA|nr:hypothetical protein As57867_004718 [Aphanomyces stellatus]VFT81829.1 Aste57867_4731 [Aphanomyces stellatus]